LVPEAQQAVEALFSNHPHIAALAAIPAVGSALLNIRLAPERHAACTTIPCLDIDACCVEAADSSRQLLLFHEHLAPCIVCGVKVAIFVVKHAP
jgi:hypothetical protein